MTTSKVDWYGEEVRLVVHGVAMDSLVKIGYQIEKHTKINISNNDQIDTGFMLNSVYTSAPDEDTYGATWPTGSYKSRKTGRMVDEVRGPKVTPPDDKTVVVAVGAEYTIFQELRKSFLMKAVEQVQGEVAEAEIETVAKRRGLRG